MNIALMFPNRLKQISQKLFKDTPFSHEKLMKDHTFYPLFCPFLSKERNEKIIQAMYGSEKKSILYQAGITQSKISFPRYLRLCLTCAYVNIEQYGEAYWHRSHQINGINRCHIHGECLRESKCHFSVRENSPTIYPLKKSMLNDSSPMEQKTSSSEHEIALSKEVFNLLTTPLVDVDRQPLEERYTYYLRQRELASYTGRVRKSQLLLLFNHFFEREFLEQLHSEIHTGRTNDWIDNLLKPRSVTHPIRHFIDAFFTCQSDGISYKAS